jgi:hypothetical protein
MMREKFHSESEPENSEISSGESVQENGGSVVSHRWMQHHTIVRPSESFLSANQRTSISAMISYISHHSGQSEFRIERKLSDHFNIPNPKCLPANDFDEAIRYLADIISM